MNEDQPHSRMEFLRDAAVFHVKLMLDGIRDVILFPVSLIAVLIDVIRHDDRPGHRFYEVAHFGRETERWINLFAAADRAPETDRPRPSIEAPGLDDIIDDIENKLRDKNSRDDLSAKVQDTVQQILGAARNAMQRSADRSA